MPETLSAEPTRILELADRLGVELDEEEALQRQASALIAEVKGTLGGTQEIEIVPRLEQLCDSLGDQAGRFAWMMQAEAARSEVINIVNDFLHSKHTGHAGIRVYIDHLQHT